MVQVFLDRALGLTYQTMLALPLAHRGLNYLNMMLWSLNQMQ